MPNISKIEENTRPVGGVREGGDGNGVQFMQKDETYRSKERLEPSQPLCSETRSAIVPHSCDHECG